MTTLMLTVASSIFLPGIVFIYGKGLDVVDLSDFQLNDDITILVSLLCLLDLANHTYIITNSMYDAV